MLWIFVLGRNGPHNYHEISHCLLSTVSFSWICMFWIVHKVENLILIFSSDILSLFSHL
jgi:hypothetical protein